uniref:Uncharacterized protein n=1 Tax=Thermosporothrix sp. COM3 TaxID=2490863 RepID=A0A455SLM5_9CHLR|nr:hypothetical protein KTC_29420 [Thermosporothrix sp. COM3]
MRALGQRGYLQRGISFPDIFLSDRRERLSNGISTCTGNSVILTETAPRTEPLSEEKERAEASLAP